MRLSRTLLAACAAALVAAPAAEGETVSGELLVRFAPDVPAVERADARRDAGADAVRALPLPGVQLLETERGARTASTLAELRDDPRVLWAEPNQVVRAAAVPNDPQLTYMANLARVRATTAWATLTAPADPVVVAVADTGVAPDHPDLQPVLVAGRDVVSSDADPSDPNGHGTHVAGTIAAAGDNGVGVTGLAWSAAKVMPIRVLGTDGSGTTADLATGIDWAGDHGADVLNASLSGSSASSAVADAIAAHPQMLVLAAAGNDNADVEANPRWPCAVALPNVLCVGATQSTADTKASFSNFGPSQIDLAAPGTGIRSTTIARWADDFVDGTTSGWTSTAGAWGVEDFNTTIKAVSESPGRDDQGAWRQYAPAESSHLTTTQPVDVGARGACRLAFSRWQDVPSGETGDVAYVATSPDGATWTDLWSSGADTGSSLTKHDLALPTGQDLRLRLGFRADGDPAVGDGVAFTRLAVTCPGGSGAAGYGPMDGTSMATPLVAGAAALVRAARPQASVAEVRAALLDGAVQVDGLRTAFAEGRRLDAAGALAAPAPPVLPALPSTGAASAIGPSSATLHGSVDPEGTSTALQFEWGTSAQYGQSSPAQPVDVGAGTAPVAQTSALTGLQPDTRYHFRVVAVRGSERVAGLDQSFTTATQPAAEPDPVPPAVGDSSATAGRTDAATLAARVDPRGLDTAVWFEFGATTALGRRSDELAIGRVPSDVSVALGGLAARTTYHWRVAARSSAGTAYGPVRSFVTEAAAAAPPASPEPGTAPRADRPRTAFAPRLRCVRRVVRRRTVVSCRLSGARVARAVLTLRRRRSVVARASGRPASSGALPTLRARRRLTGALSVKAVLTSPGGRVRTVTATSRR